MNKHIVLSLLMMSSTFTHAMKNTSSFSSFSLNSCLLAWLSGNQTPNERKQIADLKKDVNDLEKQLNFEWFEEQREYNVIKETCSDPFNFLRYCYYQKYHEYHIKKGFSTFEDIVSCLDSPQKIEINGYSALSAAMLANDISADAKYKFIQKLINHDFKPTSKDIMLANFIFYDEVTKGQQKELLCLLSSISNFPEFPNDIKTLIAHDMIQLFKNDYWLLNNVYIVP